MTIHDPIYVTKDTDKAELRTKCHDIIYSALPPIYHNKGTSDETLEKKKN